jgi:hypothetical protein
VKTFSRLVAVGAVASGAGGMLLAVTAPVASASPKLSATNTLVTVPELVTISAYVDPLNTAVLYVNGVQVDSVNSPVQFGRSLKYSLNAAHLGNGTYPVEEVEKTAGLLEQTARSTITVRIPQSSGGSSGSGSSGGSSGSGGSGAHSGAVSGSSSGGRSSSRSGSGSSGLAGAAGNADAPAVIGPSGPAFGGTGLGSSYSRLLALSGSSSLVLPNVAPQNGFQLPIKPTRQAKLASSPSRATSLTAASWLIGVALALIMLLTAAHTGAWARRRHRRPGLAGATAVGGDADVTTATVFTAVTADSPVTAGSGATMDSGATADSSATADSATATTGAGAARTTGSHRAARHRR